MSRTRGFLCVGKMEKGAGRDGRVGASVVLVKTGFYARTRSLPNKELFSIFKIRPNQVRGTVANSAQNLWRARAHCMPVVPGVARAGEVTVVACNKLSAARVVAVLLEAEAVPAEGGTHVLAAAAVGGIDHIEPAGAGLRIRLVVVQRVAFVASERVAGGRAVVATALGARLKCRAAVGPSWWGRRCTARRIARVFARVMFRARRRQSNVAVAAGRWLLPAARGLTNARVARTAVVGTA